jgi:dihydroxyacid dehydratase/phosphogluconate dehydratase
MPRRLKELVNAILALQSNYIRSGNVCIMHSLSNKVCSLFCGARLHDVTVISDSSIIGMGCGPILISKVHLRFDQGGPISRIKDGDIIDINIENRKI